MLTNSLKQANEVAAKELRERGCELLKGEDRFGETKTGWWQDGVWLAPANKPQDALRILLGG